LCSLICSFIPNSTSLPSTMKPEMPSIRQRSAVLPQNAIYAQHLLFLLHSKSLPKSQKVSASMLIHPSEA
jgi:hypothetical protein